MLQTCKIPIARTESRRIINVIITYLSHYPGIGLVILAGEIGRKAGLFSGPRTSALKIPTAATPAQATNAA
jgi:hypothetical protein